MKGQILIFFISILFIATTNAQDEGGKDGGLFVRANVGYGFEGIDGVQGVDRTQTIESNIYGSTAPGLGIGLGVGYMFNKYIGIELGATYTFGKSKFSEVKYEELPLGLEGGGSEFSILNAFRSEKYTHQSKQLRVIPAIIVRGGDGKIAPYAKVGLVVPVMGKTSTTVDGSVTSTEIPTSIAGISIPGFDSGVSLVGSVDAEAESFGSFSMGFDATLGVDYRISDKISLFGEVNMVALTIKSKETKVLKYDGVYALDGSPLTLDDLSDAINGVVDLANLIPGVDLGSFSYTSLGLYENISEVPSFENEIIYVDELNANSNNELFNDNVNTNLPEDQLARRDNNSSIGINVGIKFNF